MYKTVPLKYSMFYEKDNPVFGESATHISIDDDAAGGYIVLEQFSDDGSQKLRLDLHELEELLRIANKLMSEYNKVTALTTKQGPSQYILEEHPNYDGSIFYRYRSDGMVGNWVATKEEAVAQAENTLVTEIKSKPPQEHYIIVKEECNDYGECQYRFKSLFNGVVGTWFDTEEEAIKQAENRVNLG